MEKCGAPAGTPGPRLLPLPSEPEPVGGRGELGLVARDGRGVGRPDAPRSPWGAEAYGSCRSWVPSCEKAGLRQAAAGSGPAPLGPATGPLSRGPAYARAPAARATAGDVALRGAAAGPTCRPAAFPRLPGAPSHEASPAERLRSLLSSTPLLPPLSPTVVVPAGASFSTPAGSSGAPPSAPSFGRRGGVIVFSESVPFFF